MLCFIFIVLSLSASRLYCQNDTVQLNEIEVIGLKPEISTNSPNPVQQLNTKKIEAIPTTSVAEAIRNFTGVAVKDFGGVGGLKTVMIRSLGANHTSVFIDGLPNNDLSTGQIDLGRISLNDVGNIQLSVGQPEFNLMTARMHASAGVLDIHTKDPDFSLGNSVINVTTRIGSFGTLNPSIGLDSKWKENISTALRVNYYVARGNFPYEVHNGSIISNLERQNSDIKTTDVLLKAKISFSDSSTLNIKTSYYHSDRGLPGAVIYYNMHSSQRLQNNDLISGFQYKTKPGKISMLVSSGFSNIRLLYTDPDFQNQNGGIKNEYNQQEFYLSDALMAMLTKSIKLSFATDIIISILSTNAYSVKNPMRISSMTATSISFKHNKTEVQASALVTAGKDKSQLQNIDFFRLSPAVSIMRDLTSDRTLKARFSFKSIYRLPTFNDLYYIIAGNNKLKPENASMFNLGLLYNKAFKNKTGLTIRIDGFANEVKNKIVTLPTQNLFIWSTMNIGRVDIKGLEVSGSIIRHFNRNWSADLTANYTYQEATDVTEKEDNNYGNQIAYIPYETASLLATSYYRDFSIGVNTLFNGFRYAASDNIPANLLDEWATTDITISWQTLLQKQLLRFKAEAVNVFNKQYEVVRGFPITGRGFYLNIYLTIK
jgi:vitamin B12 transporter